MECFVAPSIQGKEIIAASDNGIREVAEEGWRIVPVLPLAPRKINRAGVEAAWGSGFKAGDLESEVH